MEHVNHVSAVSYSIANYLGLNTELTRAIAIGHDLGHPPFGHQGEVKLTELIKRDLNDTFWHEGNSLHFIDNIETLRDFSGYHQNLILTYAVRDGIICHCGEVDEKIIKPRTESIILEEIKTSNQFSPYTWEGCVVKISDKISYLGRDIEDAQTLGILDQDSSKELVKIARSYIKTPIKELNTTVIMQDLIKNLCENSSPEEGLRVSDRALTLVNCIKEFNYKNIYNHWKVKQSNKYTDLIIETIYEFLNKLHFSGISIREVFEKIKEYPVLSKTFIDWLKKYSKNIDSEKEFRNLKIYDLKVKQDFKRAIIDYISGMTDAFAIRVFKEIISF